MSINRFQEMSPLEKKLLSFMQTKVNLLNPKFSLKTDPMRNIFLRKESYELRGEFLDGNRDLLVKRRDRLKKIFLQDAMDQEKTLRKLGYAYIPTQP